jgi:hypothetical protein
MSSPLHQRLFAAACARGLKGYTDAMAAREQALFGDLHGRVLEVGPGPGTNLKFFASDVEWTGLEPNRFMVPRLERTAEKRGVRIRVLPGYA